MDTEILPPVAKKQKQLNITNFFGGANNARPSINAQVERETPTPNYVVHMDQDRLVPTRDQDIAVALSWRLAGTPSWLMDQRHASLNLNVGNANGLKYHLAFVQAI